MMADIFVMSRVQIHLTHITFFDEHHFELTIVGITTPLPHHDCSTNFMIGLMIFHLTQYDDENSEFYFIFLNRLKIFSRSLCVSLHLLTFFTYRIDSRHSHFYQTISQLLQLNKHKKTPSKLYSISNIILPYFVYSFVGQLHDSLSPTVQ